MNQEALLMYKIMKDEIQDYLSEEMDFMAASAAFLGNISIEDLGLFTGLFEFSWLEALYNRSGQKDYEISISLAEKLLVTDLKGVEQLSLKLPFEAIKIFIPNGFTMPGLVRLDHPRWLIVSKVDSLIDEEDLGIYGTVSTLRLGWEPRYGSTRTTCGPLFPDTDLSEIKNTESLTDGQPAEVLAIVGDTTNLPELNRLLQWVANVVMYSTMIDVRQELRPTNKEWIQLGIKIQNLPASPKKERLKAQRRSLQPGYRIYIGGDIKPLGPAVAEGDPLTVRTLVSGHWRQQVHGPAKLNGEWIPAKDRQHKRIFIEPFWKGPDLAPETNPIRVLHP